MNSNPSGSKYKTPEGSDFDIQRRYLTSFRNADQLRQSSNPLRKPRCFSDPERSPAKSISHQPRKQVELRRASLSLNKATTIGRTAGC